MIKLIACDVDGTLLPNPNNNIDEKFYEFANKFIEKGVVVTIASGRQLSNLRTMFNKIDDKISYISGNGSIICHKNNIIFKSPINKNLVKELSKKIYDNDELELVLTTEHMTYIIPKTEAFKKRISNDIKDNSKVIKCLDTFLNDLENEVLKVTMYFQKGKNDKCIEKILDGFDNKFQHTSIGTEWYDFMTLGVHKGAGIKCLQKLLNINEDETAVFGDNFNDIEMLKDAKFSYAMEDAHKDVKKYANYTCTNVADELEKLYIKYFS